MYRAKLKIPRQKNTKKFRHYRNKLNHLIRFTKKNYYKSKLDKAQGDMRATWRIINEILNKKKSAPLHISNIVHNVKQFDKKTDIANQLNKFFTYIGPTLAKKCGKTQRSYKDWMKNTCSSQLNLSQISPFKVLDELYGLDCAKAVGHDGLSISYLVKAADFIYQPLTHIFNTSIASSIFPDEMKIAKVIPLFKSGDRCTTSNYRPISLLPPLSKIFEKIICEMLSARLEQTILLFDYQFGFRKREVLLCRF